MATSPALHLNPELQRNLWLELSPARLILIPVLVLIALALSNQLDIGRHVFTGIFSFCMGIYAPFRVMRSVQEEHNTNTWDWQRLSGMRPGQLVWGKLLGAPVFAYYIALWALVGILFSSGKSDNPDSLYRSLLSVPMIAMGGFAFSAILLALILSTPASVAGPNQKRSGTVMLLFIMFLVYQGGSFLLRMSMGSNPFNGDSSLSWYGLHAGIEVSSYCNLALTIFWSLVACYRFMRRELSYQNGPGWWVAFLAFVFVYQLGFLVNMSGESSNGLVHIQEANEARTLLFYIPELTFCALAVITALREPKTISSVRRLFVAFQHKDSRRIGYDFPLWVTALAFAFISLLFGLAMQTDIANSLTSYSKNHDIGARVSAIALLLFALRDIAVLYIFWLRSNTRRATVSWFVYLAVVYFFVPMLFIQSENFEILSVFYPVIKNGLYLLPVTIECAVAGFFAYRQLQEHVLIPLQQK